MKWSKDTKELNRCIMRLFIIFSYDGSKFNGFQRQKNVLSLQGSIEGALKEIYGTDIEIKGSGRTDAGVHAIGQTATFDVPYYINNLKRILNLSLTNITIKKVKIVDADFHARFSIKKKIYLYKIKLNTYGDNPYYLCLKDLDINKMKEVSKLFIGKHNFRNFVSGARNNYETIILDIKFYRWFNNLIIKFEGVGFYRYMVRNLVGAMIDVGKNRKSLEDVKTLLEHPEIDKQMSTAKANGLYLYKVVY